MIKEVYKPKTIEETLDILEMKENTAIIAGGTDLIISMQSENFKKDILVDIWDIQTLKEIIEEDNIIKIGSSVTFNQIIESDKFDGNLKGLKKAATLVGSPQIRSRGTIGGNICNNSPSSDLIPPLLALDAKVVIKSKVSLREVYLKDILLDKNKVDIKENEILEYIIIKKPKKNQMLSFSKLGFRKSLAISKISASVFLDIEENKFKDVKLALGAISKTAIRVGEIEEYLTGKEINDKNIDEALEILENIIKTNLAGRKTVEFKSYAAKGVVEYAINECILDILRG